MNIEEIMNQIDFDKGDGLVPTIVQDVRSGEVLMLAYMNEESLKVSLEKKVACYYSRSRSELWLKGETSGHYQYIKEMYVDCDSDTLLLKVEQVGVACHTGAKSCFYTSIMKEES